MDEEEAGREQARLLRRAMVQANLQLDELWLHYFSIGGDAGPMEVDAYLNHAMGLPRLQRDVLAHALNELADDRPSPRAPYAKDLSPGDTSRNDHRDDDDSRGS